MLFDIELTLALGLVLLTVIFAACRAERAVRRQKDVSLSRFIGLIKNRRVPQFSRLPSSHAFLHDIMEEAQRASGHRGDVRLFVDHVMGRNAGAMDVSGGFDTVVIGSHLLREDLTHGEWLALFSHEISHIKKKDSRLSHLQVVIREVRSFLGLAPILTVPVGLFLSPNFCLSATTLFLALTLLGVVGELWILSLKRSREIEADKNALRVAGLGAYLRLADRLFPEGKSGLLDTHPRRDERVRAVLTHCMETSKGR